MEIEKLFDLGDTEKPSEAASDSHDQKEEKKPISPPTESIKSPDRMRLSMGSRPAFLDQLRNPVSKESK